MMKSHSKINNCYNSTKFMLCDYCFKCMCNINTVKTIANITFRTLHSFQPAYLFSTLHANYSTFSLRLSNTNLLSFPFVRTSSLGTRRFSVAGLTIWNQWISVLHQQKVRWYFNFLLGFCWYFYTMSCISPLVPSCTVVQAAV